MSETAPHGGGGPRRWALVTGASSGIGEAFARRLAQDGYDLVLVARRREALESLAEALRGSRGVEVEVMAADLTDPGELRGVEERLGREPTVNLLVNNAGFGTECAFEECDVDREERQIRLNVLALVRLTRAALPRMRAAGAGDIVNVSSLAALAPLPWSAVYGATKAFVNSFTESLAEELRGSGVRVQALCPGFTRTGFQEVAGVDPSEIPSLAWMEPGPVVDASLAALRRGDVVCVPGVGNRALAAVTSASPRGLVRWTMGAFQGRRHRRP